MAAFARHSDAFVQRGAALLGLSVDSVFAHIAWVRNLEEKLQVKIPFPIIADLDMSVARAFGMIHAESSETMTVRTVFIIDPAQRVRVMLHYPMSTGRSIPEILRILDSLQTVDAEACATPEGWKVGEPVIVPPPKTTAEANERLTRKDVRSLDWYLGWRQP
jgi:peroxiredoxin (alkyl hydroperoxide reductase subunit C)